MNGVKLNIVDPQRVGVAVAIGLLILSLSGCGSPSSDGKYSGYVEADYVTVSAPAAGWVESPQWQYGDEIASGGLLVQLDTQLQSFQLEQAAAQAASRIATLNDALHGARSEEIAVLQSQLDEQQFTIEEARLELSRIAALREKDLATQADYDKALLHLKALEATAQITAHQIEVKKLAGRPDYLESLKEQVRAAKAAEQQANWSLLQRTIYSRVNGSIKEIYTRVGEYANPAQPLLLIQLASSRKVRFYIPEKLLSQVSLGQKVVVKQDGDNQEYQAAVSYISQQAEFTPPVLYSEKARSDLVFMIEARFTPPASLHPGQPVSVTLL